MERKRKKAVPKTAELRIRIIPLHPKPLGDGRWQFCCEFPTLGSPGVRIVAKDAKDAKAVLGEYLYNELDGRDDLEDRR